MFEFCFSQEIDLFLLLSKPWVSVGKSAFIRTFDTRRTSSFSSLQIQVPQKIPIATFFPQLVGAGTLLLMYTDYL